MQRYGFFLIVKIYLLLGATSFLVSEGFALLEEPYRVAVAGLGHEGEEVGAHWHAPPDFLTWGIISSLLSCAGCGRRRC